MKPHPSDNLHRPAIGPAGVQLGRLSLGDPAGGAAGVTGHHMGGAGECSQVRRRGGAGACVGHLPEEQDDQPGDPDDRRQSEHQDGGGSRVPVASGCPDHGCPSGSATPVPLTEKAGSGSPANGPTLARTVTRTSPGAPLDDDGGTGGTDPTPGGLDGRDWLAACGRASCRPGGVLAGQLGCRRPDAGQRGEGDEQQHRQHDRGLGSDGPGVASAAPEVDSRIGDSRPPKV